jgi:hypothetical protein
MKRETKPNHSRQNGKRSITQQMNKNYLPDLPPVPSTEGSESGSESASTVGNGPFGLSKGLRKEDIDIQMMEVKQCFYKAESLPKKHSAFQYYILQITPVQGLSMIKPIGNPVYTSAYGIELRRDFETMKEKLEKLYGRAEIMDFMMKDSIWSEPRDWMQALINKERHLAALWDNKKVNSLPSDLESIYLYAAAEDTNTGYIVIEYYFSNHEASDREIEMLEDDAL